MQSFRIGAVLFYRGGLGGRKVRFPTVFRIEAFRLH